MRLIIRLGIHEFSSSVSESNLHPFIYTQLQNAFNQKVKWVGVSGEVFCTDCKKSEEISCSVPIYLLPDLEAESKKVLLQFYEAIMKVEGWHDDQGKCLKDEVSKANYLMAKRY